MELRSRFYIDITVFSSRSYIIIVAISQFRKSACSLPNYSLTKAGLLSFFSGTSTETILSNISDENWQILSFNPTTKEVCIQVSDRIGTRILSLTLPTLNKSN